MRWLRRTPLWIVLTGVLALYMVAAVAVAMLLEQWIDQRWIAGVVAVALLLPIAALHASRLLSPMTSLFRALAGSVATYRDGDYSSGLAWNGQGELEELVSSHNQLGDVLRTQRIALVQRELLLDTMVQHTPVAMLLVDPTLRVVHANVAARKTFGQGRKLEGQALDALLAAVPEAMRDAFARGGDGLFSVGSDDDEEIFHLARRTFRLNGRRHELLLLRQMTTELRRQEVQTWKKVIRVISHELNNSLAPIASLAHTSGELLRRGQHAQLPEALATIAERARHLEGFIRDYARFARLPAPRREPVEWARFIAQLRSQVPFVHDGAALVGTSASFDTAQIEQALLNLLKNAHESGSAEGDVELVVRRTADGWRVDVLDRGTGMNTAVLSNAVLPFYSTKRNGTGLGLALVREIAEAHGGRIALLNREEGGLCVGLVLPD